jgi:hypothetical protein
MSEISILYGATLLFCILAGACVYIATRMYNLQVVVIDNGHWIDPEYEVFGDRYSPLTLFMLPFLYYMVAQFIRAIISIDIGSSMQIAIFPVVFFAMMGFVFGATINTSRRFKAIKIAEYVYRHNNGGILGRYIEVDLEDGRTLKLELSARTIPQENRIMILDGRAKKTKAMIRAMSSKERQWRYPIITDHNPHTR